MARQGRPTGRSGRARRAAGGAASNALHGEPMHDDDALAGSLDEDWQAEPEWSTATPGAGDDAARRRPRGTARVHTPAWQLIDRYREDKWLRERIKEVYDD